MPATENNDTSHAIDSEEAPFRMVDLEPQRLEQYARDQLETIRCERLRLADERKTAEIELERRRAELEQRTRDLVQQADPPENALSDAEGSESDILRRQCFEYQFQIELLQAERDAAWTQARKGRGRADSLQGELDAARFQAEVQTADFQRRLDALQQERDEARFQFEKWRQCPDDQVDLSGPPSTRTNLTPETFGLEHTDLKLGDPGDVKRDCEECAGLRDQLTQLRLDWDRHDVEFARMRHQVQGERDALAADTQALYLRQHTFEQFVAAIRRELAAERMKLCQEVTSFHQDVESERRQMEEREAEVRRHRRALQLQESELRELAHITENECANERAKLTEERLRIARLREALRLEREQQKKAADR